MLLQESHHRHHKTRSAKAALKPVTLVKCLLHRVQGSGIRSKAFDRRHLMAFRLDRQQEARTYRCAVQQRRAATAHTVLAADVGAGQARVVTDEVRQQRPVLDFGPVLGAVDLDRDPHGRARSAAWATIAVISARW